MTTAVQRRRGTNTEHASFTGLEGEISVNTTNESVHVHDGSTAGGFELMRADGANSTVTLGDISGVTAGTGLSGGGTTGTVTLDIDGTVATLAGTQTFTNKTLTSPILNTPTIGTSFTIGGATITETELEILDGATVTTTELNYVDGVTSAIQTQIDAKAPLASPSFTGNVSVGGTVDGRDLSVDGAKLDLINQGVATTDSPAFAGGTFTGTLNITPTSGYANIEVGGVDGAFIDLKAPSSDDYDMRMITSGGSGGTIDVGAAGDLSLRAGGSERVTLLSSGNLGIGTASPSKTLVVNENDSECVAIIKSSDTGTAGLFLGGQTDEIKGGIVFNNSDNSLQLRGYNNAERMRIDSSGNVGIGTTSPSEELELASSSPTIRLTDTDDSTYGSVSYNVNALLLNGDNTIRCYTGDTERMRIDGSGNLLVGGTTINAQGSFTVRPNQNNGSCIIQMNRANTTATSTVLAFYNNNSVVGTIAHNNTGTAYNTSSDQRLKENIADADDAGSKIDAIQVRQYDWKADGSHQDYGVIAQELVEIAPEAVTVPADSEEMMGVDYSKLVPMLIKEIQSLRNRIAALEE